MVKEKIAPTVFLEHMPTREHAPGNLFEQVTEPNVSPSLYNMVLTGNVGSFGANLKYSYLDVDEDDEDAHDRPDYMQLNQLDVTLKQQFVDDFIANPNNYEKPKEEPKKEEPKAPQKGEPEPGEGEPGHV